MTTAVIVEANHGWPAQVTVTEIAKASGGGAVSPTVSIVPAGERRCFHLRSGGDLHVRDLPPDEAGEAQASP